MEYLPSALRLLIRGRVQGVGFRPFVSRLATAHNLLGWVQNRQGEVVIWVEGQPSSLKSFQSELISLAPPLAQPETPLVQPVAPAGYRDFSIRPSVEGQGADVHIPPDYFVCDDCLKEMQDPKERRYRYPFINCTQCGPRYTLIDRLPYDRPNTAMAEFGLCPACRAEYENPLDRRFHAQPLACPVCGPGLVFRSGTTGDVTDNEGAMAAASAALRAGLTVAMRGVGGYHLLCDAGNESAVQRLRARKHRPAKPLAVMLTGNVESVYAVAKPEASELALLQSPLRPIVLMAKIQPFPLAESIAPGLAEVGVMQPYSPLHHLLAEGFGGALVATSANLSGEPVLTEPAEVERRLGQVADAFLHHNRPIRRPADDSVYRRIAGKARPIRLGRGLAPLEIDLPFELSKPVLAVGADLKNTVALGFGRRVVISPHIGDLGAVRSGEVFARVVADLQQLYQVQAEILICDAHPDYHSSRWAAAQKLPVQWVLHHHAHASALAGEHGIAEELLVFTWDGVGFGADGTIWGCEALLGRPGAWDRVASIRPFRLLGGEKANREPWRNALSLCWEVGLEWEECPKQAELLRHAYQRGINCPQTRSAGRLFDAAAALIGIQQEASFEGEAAMGLEAISSLCDERIELELIEHKGLWESDWSGLLPMLRDDGLDQSTRGSLFHSSLAGMLLRQAEKIRETRKIHQVGLTGGVFQNRLLTEHARFLLELEGFEVLLAECIPCNDAGISFGQVVEAGSGSV